MLRSDANTPRYAGRPVGHYESYFIRANHPSEPLAFWIRYTTFAPTDHSSAPIGELWAAMFDGRSGRNVAVRMAVPIDDCDFSALPLRVGEAHLSDATAAGRVETLAWDLRYDGGGEPLLLLAERLYAGGFAKAKVLTPAPLARFHGHLDLDGERIDVDGWIGSQNHNWGPQHTDQYAWGQVAGFDGEPDAFLECSTARIRIGGVPSPWLSPIVVRYGGSELRFNEISTSVRAKARYTHAGEQTRWVFRSRGRDADGRRTTVDGEITAPRTAFVTLQYANPLGGHKTCLNSKIAECRLRITSAGGTPIELIAANRAAFEIVE